MSTMTPLSREEVNLIEWLRCQVEQAYVVPPGAIAASRLKKAKELITRLRAQPQAAPPEATK